MEGWIKLHRKLADDDFWLRDPFTRGQAWVDLLMLANYKDGHVRVRGNFVEVKRGQVGWSIKALAKRWKWSRGKVSRFLFELESKFGHQIEQQNNPITSIITITNYERYQKTDTKTGSRRTADGQQTDTNKKEKKGKNEKNKYMRASDLFDLWNEEATNLPKAVKLSPERRRKSILRLKERTLEEHRVLIRRINKSHFCQGNGDRGWKADYGWYVQSAEIAVKIEEGKYDNPEDAEKAFWDKRLEKAKEEDRRNAENGL